MTFRLSRAERSEPDFNPIARLYRWLEYCTFGRILESCRLAQLACLHDARSALFLGDGDGRFLAELVRINPALEADIVDISDVMLTLARARTPRHARVRFEQADIRTYKPASNRSYDLLVTHFFLDCLTEQDITKLIKRLNLSLCSHTTWIVSEFAVPAKGLCRLAGYLLVRALYLAFRMLTGLRVQKLPNYAPILEHAGFVREDFKLFLGGILRSERWCSNSSACSQATASASYDSH